MLELLPDLAVEILIWGFSSRFSTILVVVIVAVLIENCDYILYQLTTWWKLNYSNVVQLEFWAIILPG